MNQNKNTKPKIKYCLSGCNFQWPVFVTPVSYPPLCTRPSSSPFLSFSFLCWVLIFLLMFKKFFSTLCSLASPYYIASSYDAQSHVYKYSVTSDWNTSAFLTSKLAFSRVVNNETFFYWHSTKIHEEYDPDGSHEVPWFNFKRVTAIVPSISHYLLALKLGDSPLMRVHFRRESL